MSEAHYYSDYELLAEACADGRELVEWLIAQGVDVNASSDYGFTALHTCAMADWDEDTEHVMEALLKAGADTGVRAYHGWTPLLLAAWEGRSSQLRRLIQYGADVNAVDDQGRTSLMLAIAGADEVEEKVQILVHSGARTDMRDSHGQSAWDLAVAMHRHSREGMQTARAATFERIAHLLQEHAGTDRGR